MLRSKVFPTNVNETLLGNKEAFLNTVSAGTENTAGATTVSKVSTVATAVLAATAAAAEQRRLSQIDTSSPRSPGEMLLSKLVLRRREAAHLCCENGDDGNECKTETEAEAGGKSRHTATQLTPATTSNRWLEVSNVDPSLFPKGFRFKAGPVDLKSFRKSVQNFDMVCILILFLMLRAYFSYSYSFSFLIVPCRSVLVAAEAARVHRGGRRHRRGLRRHRRRGARSRTRTAPGSGYVACSSEMSQARAARCCRGR